MYREEEMPGEEQLTSLTTAEAGVAAAGVTDRDNDADKLPPPHANDAEGSGFGESSNPTGRYDEGEAAEFGFDTTSTSKAWMTNLIFDSGMSPFGSHAAALASRSRKQIIAGLLATLAGIILLIFVLGGGSSACKDDPTFSFVTEGHGDIKHCADWVGNIARPALLEARCNHQADMGNGVNWTVKDKCQASCGVCTPTSNAESLRGSISDDASDASNASHADEGDPDCQDDPDFRFIHDGNDEIKDCASWVQNINRPALLEERCAHLPNHEGPNFPVKHYCRLTCGLCTPKKKTDETKPEEVDQEVECPDDSATQIEFDGVLKSCAEYLSTGRPNVLQNRCEHVQLEKWKVKDFCKKLCNNCYDEDDEEATALKNLVDSQANPTASDQPAFEPLTILEGSPIISSQSTSDVACEDDLATQIDNGGNLESCAEYLKTGRPAVLENRCQHDHSDTLKVRDVCRKSCGVCVDPSQGSALPQFDTKPKLISQPPPKVTNTCEDDATFSHDHDGKSSTCSNYIEKVGRPAVHAKRCNQSVGVRPDNGVELFFRDYCKKSCDVCK